MLRLLSRGAAGKRDEFLSRRNPLFERAQCAPPEALNDEPQVKRRVRKYSTPGNMKRGSASSENSGDSDSDEFAGSMGLGYDSSQSDGSGDDESSSDGATIRRVNIQSSQELLSGIHGAGAKQGP